MLYSIIPPVLVVLSLIGVIIFLVKKSHQVAGISRQEDKARENAEILAEPTGFFQKRASGERVLAESDMKHRWLIFLEKLTRKTRVLFLKLENLFTDWSEKLKEKRKNRLETKDNSESQLEEKGDVLEKVREYEASKKEIGSEGVFQRRIPLGQEDEKEARPMISDNVAEPRVEMKDRLEKLLIERIASNPKDVEAYERLGEYYFEIGNYEHSKECYKQVMKLDPRNIGVRSRMKKLERLLTK